MSLLEDLFSEDLIGNPGGSDDEEEVRVEPLFLENEAGEQNEDDPENDHISQTVPQSDNPVEPKRNRVVKNPQPKLDAERLKGPRGLSILENIFKDYKFYGKGYEKRDLDQVMKRLEHWAHRLFPKYQFDDFLEKVETLGHKKPVMVYVKKIRMGLETAESSAIEPAMEENQDDLSVPLDPFDELLEQQISQSQASEHCNIAQNNTVGRKATSTPLSPKITLTEEQRKRMETNRLLAQERRIARLRALQESHEHPADVPVESPCVPAVGEQETNKIEGDFQETAGTDAEPTFSQEGDVQQISERNPEVDAPVTTILNENIMECD